MLLTLWARLDYVAALALGPRYDRLYTWPRWQRWAKAWTLREFTRLNAELSPRSLASY